MYSPHPLILIENYGDLRRAIAEEPNAGFDLTGMMGSYSDLEMLSAILEIAAKRTAHSFDQIVFIPLDLERSVDLLEVYM